MRYLLLLPFFFLFACQDDGLPNPCGEYGYELTENGCECPEGKFSAYGTCRELKENEWYGITSGCPCEDTLFVRLGDVDNGNIEVIINEDIQLDQLPDGVDPWRLQAFPAGNQYFPSPSGDSLGRGGFLSGFLSCPLEFDVPVQQYTTLRGRFTPDRSNFNGHLYYHWGNRSDQIIDSCAFTLTR